MKNLKEILDEKGQEYKIELQKNADLSFTNRLPILAKELNITEILNEAEDENIPLIAVLRAFFASGYYAGCEFALNDHSEIEQNRFL